MAIQNFDKLNILKRRSEPYEQYFRDMAITEKQKKDRILICPNLEELIAIYFEAIYGGYQTGTINETVLKQQFVYDFYDVLSDREYFQTEKQLDKYVIGIANSVIDTTIQNLAAYPDDYDYTGETPYWVSDDRAMFISENEANTLFGSFEFSDAIKQNKGWKMWADYGDENVRPTHQAVNGAKIPIDAYFDVGRAKLLYPKDVTSELSTGAECPEEIIGCRCSCLYV